MKLKTRLRLFRAFLRNFRSRLKVSLTNDIQKPIDISKDIQMGKYCFIGKGAWICPNVVIGNYVMIAPGLAILGGDHRFDIPGKPVIYSGRPPTPKTNIEDDVWIGFRVIINAGITIGRGSVIAAGSVVTKNVEPYSIVGGCPAKVIGTRFSKIDDIETHDIMLKMPPFEGDYNLPKTIIKT